MWAYACGHMHQLRRVKKVLNKQPYTARQFTPDAGGSKSDQCLLLVWLMGVLCVGGGEWRRALSQRCMCCEMGKRRHRLKIPYILLHNPLCILFHLACMLALPETLSVALLLYEHLLHCCVRVLLLQCTPGEVCR